ncbi:TPA: hypothetical protein VDV42_004299 [Pseudomonas aeruginosa]|nr:hypothetical protein [Pseudomonas aeruginosa]
MDGKTHYCSFCGESENDLKALIKGPSALICDACVALCVELLEDSWQRCKNCERRESHG